MDMENFFSDEEEFTTVQEDQQMTDDFAKVNIVAENSE